MVIQCPKCDHQIRNDKEQLEKAKLLELCNENATVGVVSKKWLSQHKTERIGGFNTKLILEMTLYADLFGRTWEELTLFKRKYKNKHRVKTQFFLGFKRNNKWIMLAGRE